MRAYIYNNVAYIRFLFLYAFIYICLGTCTRYKERERIKCFKYLDSE